tara:strand:+ start:1534 stop:1740 length:207 start_codon:yes stop_codon:yes gene_type:complete
MNEVNAISIYIDDNMNVNPTMRLNFLDLINLLKYNEKFEGFVSSFRLPIMVSKLDQKYSLRTVASKTQ